MPADTPILKDYIVPFFSAVPIVLYLVVAVLLTVIACISLYDAVLLVAAFAWSPTLSNGVISVLNAILLTITVIVLFETVTVYFKTKHVPVRSLIVAAFTGTIRQVLVIKFENIDPVETFAIIALMGVLIAGLTLVKDEDSSQP